MRGAQIVIDWHNFAFTLMAVHMGAQHPLVRFLAYLAVMLWHLLEPHES